MRATVGAGYAAVVSPCGVLDMLVPGTDVPRMVRAIEVVWMTALVVVGRDPFTLVILFSVVGEIIVAYSSDTVAVMDPTVRTPSPGMFNAVRTVIVADI